MIGGFFIGFLADPEPCRLSIKMVIICGRIGMVDGRKLDIRHQ